MLYDPARRLKAFAESVCLGNAVARAKRKAESERARRAADFEITLDIVQRAVGRPAPEPTSTLAEQIIRAGKLARGEIPMPLSDPPPNSTAAAILRAGAKRRGELPEPEDNSPASEKAKLIILAGKRRRGETA